VWMDSSFAQWEVEGEVRERFVRAQREVEQARLARKAAGAEARLAPGSRGWHWLVQHGKASWDAVRLVLNNGFEPKEECC